MFWEIHQPKVALIRKYRTYTSFLTIIVFFENQWRS